MNVKNIIKSVFSTYEVAFILELFSVVANCLKAIKRVVTVISCSPFAFSVSAVLNTVPMLTRTVCLHGSLYIFNFSLT